MDPDTLGHLMLAGSVVLLLAILAVLVVPAMPGGGAPIPDDDPPLPRATARTGNA